MAELRIDPPSATRSNNGRFGWSIACSADMSVVAVGAPFEGGGAGIGAVYVYHGTNWATVTRLHASDEATYIPLAMLQFGLDVQMSADGSTIIVAAPSNSAAYVYDGANWSNETKITTSDYTGYNSNGIDSVDISDDASVIVLGSPYAGATNHGAAYVYDGAGWTNETKLVASDTAANWHFGSTVAISGDSTVVAVAGPKPALGTPDGAVYIYSGTSWGTETIKKPSDAPIAKFAGNGGGDFRSVDISEDGSVVIAGAADRNAPGTLRGAVYVFSGSSWGTQTILTSSAGQADDHLGASVALNRAGDTVAGGAVQPVFSPVSGFVRIWSGASFATQVEHNASDGGASNYNYGSSVALPDTGTQVAVGAYKATIGASAFGAAYLEEITLVTSTFRPQIYRRTTG